MKFTCSVEIDKPMAEVVELWNNPDNLKEWQDGFIRFEHISGEPGKPGARSRMIYKMGKRELELFETIITNNLPKEFTGRYEAHTMTNTMANRFSEIEPGKTRWEAEIEYTIFKGIIPKLLSRFMPGMFKRQTQKWLDQFKAFAER